MVWSHSIILIPLDCILPLPYSILPLSYNVGRHERRVKRHLDIDEILGDNKVSFCWIFSHVIILIFSIVGWVNGMRFYIYNHTHSPPTLTDIPLSIKNIFIYLCNI